MPVDNLSDTMQVIGQYDLVEKIAEGGMGTVYRGSNRLTGETVAIKVVPQHLLSNSVVLKRFEQEYNVARTIEHPNIVKALDYGREGDVRYLVMEFVDGESLGQKIEREGAMNEDDAIAIITQVANALGRAHQLNVIHRDVKPDNILVTSDGTVKLTDLGLVKELEADQNLTRTGRGLGTPHFMAPEQFRNAKKADARCDIYSLGATLYMMVTGELPFKSNGPLDAWMKKINNEIDAPRVVVPGLSERIDWAIRRAMSPDPLHRPECCREFVEDLTGHSTGNLSGTTPGMDALSECWWLVYTDEEGTEHTVKATEKGIRRSLKENRLGDATQIRVARLKAGPYVSLRSQPEFRDLVIVPENVVTPKSKASEAKVVPPPIPPLAKTPAPRPNSAASEACVVTPNKTVPVIQPTVPIPVSQGAGPCIHLNSSGESTDFWKWATLATVFISGGIIAALLVPFMPYVKFFLRALFS